MQSKLSRETAQAILADVLEKVPRPDVLRRHGITGNMLSRIESGKWFDEQAAREAKARKPKCPKCKKSVTKPIRSPCLACRMRALAKAKRRRYRKQTLHAKIQPDGTCQISREPDPLGFDLKPDHEEARLAERFAGI